MAVGGAKQATASTAGAYTPPPAQFSERTNRRYLKVLTTLPIAPVRDQPAAGPLIEQGGLHG
jgi:hypothetical protein